MRKKIARKVRKNILHTGAKILHEGDIKDKNWPRKQCGFECRIELDGKQCWCAGHDSLAAYRLALETAEEIKSGDLFF